MSSVKGTFENGVARPLEPVGERREGQPVIVTFLDEGFDGRGSRGDDTHSDALDELLDKCAVDVDVPDLAHEHDHYLYGNPKKD